MALTRVVDRARRHALHVGFLDDCGQRFLGGAAGFQERREIAALPELRDLQRYSAGARFPGPLPIAVALIDAVG
jgi:hypothetical protein